MNKDLKTYRNPTCTMGTDLEFFFINGEDRVVPADNILPPEDEALDAGVNPRSVFFDGIQGEVKTRPTHCRAFMLDDLVRCFRVVHKLADEKGLRISFAGAASIDEETLRQAEHPYSVLFGCSPHLSERLNGDVEAIELDGLTHMIRYSGDHIHLGSYHARILDTEENKLRTVRVLDAIVGNLLVLFENPEVDRLRRKVYGKAGVYRSTPYGLEYRTPSSIIANHPAILSLAFSLARMACGIVYSNLDEYVLSLVDIDNVRNAIDNVDRELAYHNFHMLKPVIQACSQSSVYDDLVASDYDKWIPFAALDFFIHNRLTAENVGSPVLNWHMVSKITPHHGSLTPSWNNACRSLLAHNRVGDWHKFLKSWKAEENYFQG